LEKKEGGKEVGGRTEKEKGERERGREKEKRKDVHSFVWLLFCVISVSS